MLFIILPPVLLAGFAVYAIVKQDLFVILLGIAFTLIAVGACGFLGLINHTGVASVTPVNSVTIYPNNDGGQSFLVDMPRPVVIDNVPLVYSHRNALVKTCRYTYTVLVPWHTFHCEYTLYSDHLTFGR